MSLVGTNGEKMPALRQHLNDRIASVYRNLSVECETFPADSVPSDVRSYERVISQAPAGSIVTVFTPDSTHYAIAKYAIQHKMHVLLAKPVVHRLEDHLELLRLAKGGLPRRLPRLPALACCRSERSSAKYVRHSRWALCAG